MKGVYQATNHDCTEACIASIFEIPLEMVPYLPDDDTWLPKFNKWLELRNLHGVCIRFIDQAEEQIENLKGYSLGSIPSKNLRGKLHSVVCKDGYIVWDPQLGEQDGTKLPDDWIIFIMLDPKEPPHDP
jgi:hypothetical protein